MRLVAAVEQDWLPTSLVELIRPALQVHQNVRPAKLR